MNPEDMKAQQDLQARQTAIQLADRRALDGASIKDVIADAETIVAFLMAGAQVATPEQGNAGAQQS